MLVNSSMLPLGTPAPDFDLPEVVDGRRVRLGDFSQQKALLVMFICHHCPYVVHVQHALAQLGRDYQQASLGIVAISANDASSYPDDAPEELAKMSKSLGFVFPFCYDESQKVAKAYGAECTPDFFVFDAQRLLVYRGQLDDTRPGKQQAADAADLRRALDAVLNDLPPLAQQKPSIGCNIKWKV